MAAADATWSYMRSQRCSIGSKSVGREGQHQHHQCPHHLWNCWQTPATWDQALPCKRRNQGPTAPEYGLPMGLGSLFQFPTAVKVPLSLSHVLSVNLLSSKFGQGQWTTEHRCWMWKFQFCGYCTGPTCGRRALTTPSWKVYDQNHSSVNNHEF